LCCGNSNDGGEVTDEIREMFAEADVNGDGVIDFLEFLGMMGAGNDDEGEEALEGDVIGAPAPAEP